MQDKFKEKSLLKFLRDNNYEVMGFVRRRSDRTNRFIYVLKLNTKYGVIYSSTSAMDDNSLNFEAVVSDIKEVLNTLDGIDYFENKFKTFISQYIQLKLIFDQNFNFDFRSSIPQKYSDYFYNSYRKSKTFIHAMSKKDLSFLVKEARIEDIKRQEEMF